MLIIENLKKRFSLGQGNIAALDNISFNVAAGEFLTILGPSGCGKTTLLRSIAGLESPDTGIIRLDGTSVFDSDSGVVVPPHKRDLSMVFQSYAIWPHMTVFGNVSFPLRIQRMSKSAIEKRTLNALQMVGLLDVQDRPATLLSGGQQQRVALARAITKQAKVLLLDEPLSNLDAELRHTMRVELRNLQKELGITTVYVTHDQGEALSLSDRIVLMRSGVVVQVGSPLDLYLRPRSAFAARFIGQAILLEGQVVDRDVENAVAETILGRLVGVISVSGGCDFRSVNVLVRPEHIEIRPHTHESCSRTNATNKLLGTIEVTQFSGSVQEHEVRVGSELLRVNSLTRQMFNIGDVVELSIPIDRCIIIPLPAPDKGIDAAAAYSKVHVL